MFLSFYFILLSTFVILTFTVIMKKKILYYYHFKKIKLFTDFISPNFVYFLVNTINLLKNIILIINSYKLNKAFFY